MTPTAATPAAPKFPANIGLTTPAKRGSSVRLAQYVLNKHNRLGQDFLKGPVDGVYGPLSVAATKSAKYWIGYPSDKINGIYGPGLHAYLLPIGSRGAKPLPNAYKLRRAQRLALAKKEREIVTRRKKAADIAVRQIGTVERPAGSNKVKYSDWYGMRGPWCAMFVSWCFNEAGIKFRYAYCPYVEADAKAGKNGLRLVGSKYATKGDLALFGFGKGEAVHIGFVVRNLGGGWYETVEGNTSAGDGGSQANGGGVFKRRRHISQIRCFVRLENA